MNARRMFSEPTRRLFLGAQEEMCACFSGEGGDGFVRKALRPGSGRGFPGLHGLFGEAKGGQKQGTTSVCPPPSTGCSFRST